MAPELRDAGRLPRPVTAAVSNVFITKPEFSFSLPEPLREPGAQYWHLVMTTPNVVTYALKVLIRDPDGRHLVSVLAATDQAVIEILERSDIEAVVSLVGVLPYRWDAPPGSSRCFSVNEIWLGMTETEDGQSDRAPLFVDELNETRAGLFGDVQAGKVERHRLIAKVGAPTADVG